LQVQLRLLPSLFITLTGARRAALTWRANAAQSRPRDRESGGTLGRYLRGVLRSRGGFAVSLRFSLCRGRGAVGWAGS
jgi:hypothetical protein